MNSGIHEYWRGMASGTRTNIPDRLLLMLLIPPSLAYALLQCLRAILYRTGLLKSRHLPVPVLSIGNLTVGGTGKTPVTAYIARFLLERGYRVAVLSRGYGGTLEGHTVVVSDGITVMLHAEQCGDEPFLLASTIPGLMVVIGSDRYSAGLLAMEQLKPDVFLLDDGFQHLRLHRDLDILLLDHSRPFGNGWTLPAGVLREPVSAGRRAGLIIQTRCPEGASPTPPFASKPFCAARHKLSDIVPLTGGMPLSFDDFRHKNVLAFAGIAEPGIFFEELRRKGLNLVETIAFADHTGYGDQQMARIMFAMSRSGTQFCITTEKDGVKLEKAPPALAKCTLLARLQLVVDNPAVLEKSLLNLLQK